jgi:hypothetical protein
VVHRAVNELYDRLKSDEDLENMRLYMATLDVLDQEDQQHEGEDLRVIIKALAMRLEQLYRL